MVTDFYEDDILTVDFYDEYFRISIKAQQPKRFSIILFWFHWW